MFFSQSEFDQLVLPLLPHSPATEKLALGDNPEACDEMVATLTFSHLTEPGDRFLGLLAQRVGFAPLQSLLLARADQTRVETQLPAQLVAEAEHLFQTNFSKLWANATERWMPRLRKSDVTASLEFMLQAKGKLLLQNMQEYPIALNDLAEGKPPALWVLGKSGVLSMERTVAVVGSRSTNRYGTEVTADIAAVAAENSILTVSGGAFGVDAALHHATLVSGGNTVAIMAGGLANLYPKSNLGLLHKIATSGALVAEQPPATTPAKWRFLMRNRLIAALGEATIVVQAGKTSGALSTANHAIGMGRPVAVVPGPIDSPHSVGCHDLLNQNMGMVSLLARPSAILDLLGVYEQVAQNSTGLPTLEKRALDAFGSALLEPWEVQRLAGLTVQETQIALGSLQLLGHISRVGARYVRVTT